MSPTFFSCSGISSSYALLSIDLMISSSSLTPIVIVHAAASIGSIGELYPLQLPQR